MVRRVIKKKFKYAEARNQTRLDQKRFDWLVGNGYINKVGEDAYELTEKGRASAELGEYGWEPVGGGGRAKARARGPAGR